MELNSSKTFFTVLEVNNYDDFTINFKINTLTPIDSLNQIKSDSLISVNNNLIKEIASYKEESMILLYRNSILVQFHPERTKDGLKFINNWIRSSYYDF